jgi:hypothetical protein
MTEVLLDINVVLDVCLTLLVKSKDLVFVPPVSNAVSVR